MTEQQSTTAENTQQQNQKKSFKYDEEAILGIRNVENRKDTKKMDRALQDFKDNRKGCEDIEWFSSSKTQKVALDVGKLGKLHELAKGAKAETVDLTVEKDQPVHVQLLDEHHEEAGEILLAPKIFEDIEYQREEITDRSTQKQAENLLKQGLEKLEESDLSKQEKRNLLDNLTQRKTAFSYNGGENQQ